MKKVFLLILLIAIPMLSGCVQPVEEDYVLGTSFERLEAEFYKLKNKYEIEIPYLKTKTDILEQKVLRLCNEIVGEKTRSCHMDCEIRFYSDIINMSDYGLCKSDCNTKFLGAPFSSYSSCKEFVNLD